MLADESKAIIDKLVEVVDLLCGETANLVDDYATRVTRESVAGVRGKANMIRKAAQELCTIAGRSAHTQGQ
jgi:hypothetical protein